MAAADPRRDHPSPEHCATLHSSRWQSQSLLPPTQRPHSHHVATAARCHQLLHRYSHLPGVAQSQARPLGRLQRLCEVPVPEAWPWNRRQLPPAAPRSSSHAQCRHAWQTGQGATPTPLHRACCVTPPHRSDNKGSTAMLEGNGEGSTVCAAWNSQEEEGVLPWATTEPPELAQPWSLQRWQLHPAAPCAVGSTVAYVPCCVCVLCAPTQFNR